jgi:hypothetical protein
MLSLEHIAKVVKRDEGFRQGDCILLLTKKT